MELEDALRCALRDTPFYTSMEICHARSSGIGFLTFVRKEDRVVLVGDVADEDDVAGYRAGYFLRHSRILQEGVVLLGKWRSFSESYLAQLFVDYTQGKIDDPQHIVRINGLSLQQEDFTELNELRGCYNNVVLVRGYGLAHRRGEFPFVAYQQRAPIDEGELRMITERSPEQLKGYYHILVGKRFIDGSVHFVSSSRKRELQALPS